ncbi:MAG: hypothetical protein HYZ71_13950 [Deltaproteobacteria bacterium]|nr:hypothetical protein [Deltaproteobacteria bacterium]
MTLLFLALMSIAWAETPASEEEYKTYWKSFKVEIRPPVDERLYNDFLGAFSRAGLPPYNGFEKGQIVTGECVSKLDPEKKISSSLGIHIGTDLVMGKKVYFVQLFYDTAEKLKQEGLLKDRHSHDRDLMGRVTMLRELQPGPYTDEALAALSNALLYTSLEQPNPITKSLHTDPQHFIVRASRPDILNSLVGSQIGTLWVAQLCGDRGGCLCPPNHCFGSAAVGTPALICSYDFGRAVAFE